ncbi:hypothetical protein [Actinacidiphila sp. ITFR-21]|uniref:hypothetical protein n=1 Tax=Actinacidiphila sp. ITFR-21 TaxID=3075199 RepID=UPI00288ADD0D|nr:hypothetical protein [Streptomyces sp. ITFR-21]WNI15545.1 hypothetical protein RLT57_08415 [Streptomyces sp. ITFR-21]
MSEPRLHGVTATPRPDGADLHVDTYLRTTLHDLIGLLDERPDLLDDLLDLYADPAPAQDRFAPARPDRGDELVERLLTGLRSTIRLYGPDAQQLGADLDRITRAQAAPARGEAA